MLHRRVGRFAVGVALFAWLLSGVPVDATSDASGTHPRATTTGASTKATRTARKPAPPKPTASKSTTSSTHHTAVGRMSRSADVRLCQTTPRASRL